MLAASNLTTALNRRLGFAPPSPFLNMNLLMAAATSRSIGGRTETIVSVTEGQAGGVNGTAHAMRCPVAGVLSLWLRWFRKMMHKDVVSAAGKRPVMILLNDGAGT